MTLCLERLNSVVPELLLRRCPTVLFLPYGEASSTGERKCVHPAKCDSQIRLCHILLALLTALACREDGTFPVEWGPVQIVFAMLGIHPMRHPCSLYVVPGTLARSEPTKRRGEEGTGGQGSASKIRHTAQYSIVHSVHPVLRCSQQQAGDVATWRQPTANS